MNHVNDRTLLAEKLSGQRLVIPDMRPLFGHWPSRVNKNYEAMREIVEKKHDPLLADEKSRKTVNEADPALLAAMWWPTSSLERYRVMTDLVIWFALWDDKVEELAPGSGEDAEVFRASTKDFVRYALGLGALKNQAAAAAISPLIRSFKRIAEEVCDAYDEDQREILLRHFEAYIDATRLESEAERSELIPSLEQYWEVRVLSSGMGTLLGFSELALNVKLPSSFVCSQAYDTLWVTTIVINSIVNDLISFKKEMRAGSVLSSVAILYHQTNDLDLAVQMSLEHIRQLIETFDRTATETLSDVGYDALELDAALKVIDLMRMINTGNLEWSLQARRYGVAQHMTDAGQIDLVL
ncbi:isoprenoid synthase domain-containing protein [Biscogniauxia mediterranea]|nr:isoprenoid synthase domain-containing protein [Biscogniauxia mediterranea]